MLFQPIEGVHFKHSRFRSYYRDLCDQVLKHKNEHDDSLGVTHTVCIASVHHPQIQCRNDHYSPASGKRLLPAGPVEFCIK